MPIAAAPSPHPQILQRSHILETAEGERCFGLWSYADGDGSLTLERTRVLGRTLAEIHAASDSFQTSCDTPGFDLEALLYLPKRRLERFFADNRHQDMVFLSSICERLSNQLHSLLEVSSCSFGPIWGDANGSNQHFTKDDEITIFDLEFSGSGWRLYDLATFQWARDREMRDNQGLWGAVLEGYESVRPLSKEEKELIPRFVLLRHIWVLGSTVAENVEFPEMAPVFLTCPARWDRAFSVLREIAGKVDLD